ncbi:hypothetical protein RDV89_13415 [Nocardioides zeae]|uniref:Uncharacterized protein n=1 Tax=Nocardioides imazamoxiresistens TaxID=3231893 RepID=A0ABU3PZ79_9ACTN|nr:hypothetical protein [Nocardioides zeae]MDT9594075.1 hypothetical protein [Nocardioides zeae]
MDVREAIARGGAVAGAVLMGAALAVPLRVAEESPASRRDLLWAGERLGTPAVAAYLVVCLAVVVALLAACRRRPARSRRVGAAALVPLGAAGAWLVTLPGRDDVLLWDGTDARGRPTGGMVTADLWVGAWCGVAGGVLLALAGLALLVLTSRRAPGR